MYQENLCNMIKVSYPISQNFSFQYSLILKLRKSNIKEALIIVFCVLSWKLILYKVYVFFLFAIMILKLILRPVSRI